MTIREKFEQWAERDRPFWPQAMLGLCEMIDEEIEQAKAEIREEIRAEFAKRGKTSIKNLSFGK